MPSGGYEGEDEAAGQVYELRREQQEVCVAEAQRVDALARRSWWTTAVVFEQLAHMEIEGEGATESLALQRRTNELLAGVEHRLEGTLPVEVPAGVEVANQPDTELVRQAVTDNTETVNQNVWAVLGLLVGFGALAVIYKLVRP